MSNKKTKPANLRKSGILVHPTSFPSSYGVGDLGQGAYSFIDFLVASNQKLWQVLPLGPTGFGDSPYQAFSSFAGQPLIISPEKLIEDGLLTHEDLKDYPYFEPTKIDYGPMIEAKTKLLKLAYENFTDSAPKTIYTEFKEFCSDNEEWLTDYALFMATKDYFKGAPWTMWDEDIAFPTVASKAKWISNLEKEVTYYKFLQYLFYKQWFELKSYANEKEVEIIGDIPIFVAFDSADVWANKELFQLDEKGHPLAVAGVPPDYFSETGQLWGNPLYDWPIHKKTKYSWWINRVGYTLKLVDYLRIDHFRGFDAYWSVPYGNETAIEGEWLPGPSKSLFEAFQKAFGKHLAIIAEDLGVITKEVRDLRDSYELPGMKILQFAFEDIAENDFLPHHYTTNCICYTGTHDNDTTVGWYNSVPEISRDKVRKYMNTDGNDVAWDFIRTCFASVALMAIVPIQDIMSLDENWRMNTPGVAAGNWQFRYTNEMLHQDLCKKLLYVSELYGRNKPLIQD